jgi:hypothetical protein
MKFKTFKELIESKTIGQQNIEPNDIDNPVHEGDGEDARLIKIRQFKGNVEDYKNYWYDRINKGNSSTFN